LTEYLHVTERQMDRDMLPIAKLHWSIDKRNKK